MSFFKRTANPNKKVKKAKVTEIQLPAVQGKPTVPLSRLKVMTIDDCVKYALEHNP